MAELVFDYDKIRRILPISTFRNGIIMEKDQVRTAAIMSTLCGRQEIDRSCSSRVHAGGGLDGELPARHSAFLSVKVMIAADHRTFNGEVPPVGQDALRKANESIWKSIP
jgi:hypothetical protein